jgi:hypothetical protein
LIDRNDKETFVRGLREQGFTAPPIFVDRGTEYTFPDGLSCVVMTSPADNSLENRGDIPIILFSWIDPGLSSQAVKLIFDDSPWALAFESAKALQQQGPLPPVASEFLLLRDRIGDAELRQDLERALKNDVPL